MTTHDGYVVPCPRGFYRRTGEIFCSPCPPGKTCDTKDRTNPTTITTLQVAGNDGQVDYSPLTENDELACLPGYMCSPDGYNRYACPLGYFPFDGGCKECPSGKLCLSSSSKSASCKNDVTFSPVGDSVCRLTHEGKIPAETPYNYINSSANHYTPKSARFLPGLMQDCKP